MLLQPRVLRINSDRPTDPLLQMLQLFSRFSLAYGRRLGHLVRLKK